MPQNIPNSKELGEQQALPNEFDSQPDSGGAIGGVRGQQEYGIGGTVSRESSHEHDPNGGTDQIVPEPSDIIDQGPVSEWTMEHSHAADEVELVRIERPDTELLEEIRQKMAAHPALKSETGLRIGVSGGVVHLFGEVSSARASLQAQELAQAMPGTLEIRNNLKTSGG